MSSMLNMTYILEFIVDGLNDRSLSKQDLVVKVHEWVLHVPPDFGDQVYVIYEKPFEEILTSGSKYLQNSSRKQKISIIFAVVIGVWIDCNLLFGSYKDTK